jgi:hypothetical protein
VISFTSIKTDWSGGNEKTNRHVIGDSMKIPANYDELNWKERRIVREEYIELQHGKCWFCGELLKGDPSDKIIGKPLNKNLFPKNFFRYPIHLHHDHETGITIGAVHSKCNAVMWQYYGV